MENLFGSLKNINEFMELDKISKLTNLRIILDFDPCFSKFEYKISKEGEPIKSILFSGNTGAKERIDTLVASLRRDGYEFYY